MNEPVKPAINEAKVIEKCESGGKATILIVDDEPNILKAIRFFLSDESNYIVVTAKSGNHAKKMIQEGLTPDVILTDIAMPDGTGLKLRDSIEQERPELISRIIFMTANEDGDLKEIIGKMVGKNRFLKKPFSVDQLIASIRYVLLELGFLK